jgi:hypothetical protein
LYFCYRFVLFDLVQSSRPQSRCREKLGMIGA